MSKRGEEGIVWRRILKPGEMEIIELAPVEIRIERRLLSVEEIMENIIDVDSVRHAGELEPPR